MCRKGRTGGGGWVHPKGVNSMAVSGLSFRKILVSNGWAISLLLFIIGLQYCRASFPALRLYCSLDGRLLAESADYCDLVYEWVRVTGLHRTTARSLV